MVLPLVLLLPIWYFLLIRPQSKQMAQQRSLLSSLKKGDDVVLQSGILGKIYSVADKVVTVEVSNGVRLRVLKTAIQTKGAVVEDAAVVPVKAEEKEEK